MAVFGAQQTALGFSQLNTSVSAALPKQKKVYLRKLLERNELKITY